MERNIVGIDQGSHWISISEAARLLNVSTTTIRNWAELGDLTASRERVGTRDRWAIDLASVEARHREQLEYRRPAINASHAVSDDAEFTNAALLQSQDEAHNLRSSLASANEVNEHLINIGRLHREIDDLRSRIEDEWQAIHKIQSATVGALNTPPTPRSLS